MRLTLRCTWLAILLSTQISASDNRHIIAAAELSGLFTVHSDSANASAQLDGVYYQLLSNILAETGLAAQYSLQVMPMKRAKTAFNRRAAVCYSPGLETFDPAERALLPDNIISSKPFNRALVRVIAKTPERIIRSIDDIKRSDVIGLVRGVPVSTEMQAILARSGKSYLVDTEIDNLKLLISGRVDLIMAFYPDILFAYQSLGVQQPYPFDPNFSPLQIIDNLACYAEHQPLIQRINEMLDLYQKNGTLQQLLGTYYLAPPTAP
jgi:polar amino acid transport system substrate-binding protein